MFKPCTEKDKIRGKFIRAYYSHSGGGGYYEKEMTESAARAKAAEMRVKGYQFGELELPAKYTCWWGDPAFQNITIEYEAYCKIELRSETLFKLPTNRERKTIGVGESVKIYSNIPVQWEIQSSLVKPSSVKTKDYSTEISFIALDKAGSVTITAKTQYTQTKMIFSIITPNAVKFEKIHDLHVKNILGTGFIANIFLLPNHVNFSALKLRELESYAIATGIMKAAHQAPHGNYENGGSEWCLAKAYVPGKGTQMDMSDFVYAGQNEYKLPFPLKEGGTVIWDIEFEWKLLETNYKLPQKIQQKTVIDTNGMITTSKAGIVVRRSYANVTLNSHEFTERNFPIPVPKVIK